MKHQVMVEAESLKASPRRPLHQLAGSMQRRGWNLKALLVLVTWVASGWDQVLPTFLGLPKASLTWHPQSSTWPSTQERHPQEGTIGCHVFDNKSRRFNWLLDDTTSSTTASPLVALTKAQTKQFAKDVENLGVDVAEVYSPPRVTQRARMHGLRPGFALDLTTGWNFNRAQHRSEALRLVREHRPALLLLSPPCTPFSSMRQLTDFKRNPYEVQKERQEGERHVNFSVSLALIQVEAGRGFLFEHPRRAKSWKMKALQQLANHPQVYTVALDMCQFGLKNTSGDLVLKPTILLTNVEILATTLSRRCAKLHKHAPLEGGQNTKLAAIYTDSFVDAILRGLRAHLRLQHFPVFGIEDSWELTPRELRCRHFNQRKEWATPSECLIFPTHKLRFTGLRNTFCCFEDRDHYVRVDDWQTSSTSTSSSPWTGTTSFELHSDFVLPQSLQELARWLCQGAAHDYFAYQTHEADFQAEWMMVFAQAFPSHRILGGDARERRAVTFADPDPESDPKFSAEDTSAPSTRSTRQEANLDSVQYDLSKVEGTEVAMENAASEGGLRLPQDDDEARVRHELREIPVPGDWDPSLEPTTSCPAPPPEIRRELYRVHRNLGHPDNSTFARALKHSGVKPEYLRWIRHGFQCPICEQKKRPASHRPAHVMSRTLPFNECVGVDLFFMGRRIFLNMVCWGTNLQLVEMIEDRTSETVAATMAKVWFAHYGAPKMVVCDQGPEFTGQEFCQLMADHAVVLHFTDTHSPWQNSRTEKAGGVFKSRLAKVCQETTAITEKDLQTAVAETCMHHNRYYDRSGFSPHQRVFGTSLRLPASLLSDDYIDKEFLAEDVSEDMQRTMEIRRAAAKAWNQHQDFEAVTRAAKANTRTVDRIPFKNGDRVYVWRSTKDARGWAGPGVVVQITENGRSLWISLRGYLLKASREQTRLATSEENFGVELRKVLTQELLEDIESGRIRHYRDIQGEEPPKDNEVEEEMSIYEPSLAASEPLDNDIFRDLGHRPTRTIWRTRVLAVINQIYLNYQNLWRWRVRALHQKLQQWPVSRGRRKWPGRLGGRVCEWTKAPVELSLLAPYGKLE